MSAMGLIVRRVGPSDWRLVRDVRLRALSDAPYAFGSTFKEEVGRDDSFWRISADRLAWFVALDASEPAGVIAVLPPESDGPDRFEIISTWVAVDHRGTGVGDALMTAAREWATAASATALTLSVTEGNQPAHRFYERLGFRSTGRRRPLRSDPTVMALEMRLPLAST
jgi:ribosomal protein S18 acetylase RimI-like enzyme